MSKFPSDSKLKNLTLPTKYNKTTLPNGIRVVTEEIPYVRSISVGVWIDVGSRDETEQSNGITHFIEHMVFKGTKRFSNQQIARSLESVGGYLNAFTTKEHTCFYARVLDEHIARALEVISELIQYPVFDEKEIEKEKSVVIEELKNIEDDPDDFIHDVLDKNIYRDHPLAYPVIGSAQSIRGLTRRKMAEYMKEYFVPDRIVIAAAGNLSHEKITHLAEKYFPSRRRGPNKRHNLAHSRKSAIKAEVIERQINQAYICIGAKTFSVHDKLRYPLLLMNTILGEGMSSRLFQNIREKYGFAYAIYSFVNMMSDTGIFGVYVGTDKEKIDISLDLIYAEFNKLIRKEISASEMARTKAQMKGNLMLGLENMSNRMMRLGSGELFFNKYISLDSLVKSIDSVRSEEVLNVADQLLHREKFSTVIFAPQKGK